MADLILAPKPKRKRILTLDDLFSRCIANPETGCIEWQGWIKGCGETYGVVQVNHRRVTAHRYAWELANGAIPNGLCVLHECDNPRCVNPKHLFLGTHDANNKDRAAKGRSAKMMGDRSPKAKITESQAIDIKSRLVSGTSPTIISRLLGIPYSLIYKIKEGKNWKHLA